MLVAALGVAGLAAAHGSAHAEVHGVFRIAEEPLGLDASDDTPFVGSHVADAITAYNAAVTAYNHDHGFSASSPMASATIDRSALGLHTTLVTFAPGLEVGGENIRFRLEGLVGVSDRVHAYGIGVYPIDLALPLSGGSITPYLLVGGTLRYLSRSDSDSETGGLATVRAAAGTRIGSHVTVELGVGLYLLGGVYDRNQLQSMASYDPHGAAPPPPADRVVSGGTQSGMIDISVGFVL